MLKTGNCRRKKWSF